MKKLFAISLLIFTIAIMLQNNLSYAQPSLKDPNLKVEAFVSGIASPTSMLFVDENNILVLEKDGNVRLVSNGMLQSQPLVSLSVDSKNERGLLGIEKIGENVFLYATVKDGQLINRIYKYTLAPGPELTNEQEFMDLPATPATNHQGGKLVASNDGYLYSVTGELQRNGKDQNIVNGPDPDFSGAILKTNANDGSPAPNNPFKSDNSNDPINWYQAYGLRNSFGLGIDPVTGALWDTENGPDYGDEINLVKPGFNSGWYKLQGVWKPKYDSIRGGDLIAGDKLLIPDIDYLENFDGRGEYSQPEFTWNYTVGPTALKFLHSDSYAKFYKDDLFVGDTNNGYLYHFDLNEDRTSLKLDGVLSDKIAHNPEELKEIIFGVNFGQITDIDVSPDGYLYILSHYKNKATIFKIVPSN